MLLELEPFNIKLKTTFKYICSFKYFYLIAELKKHYLIKIKINEIAIVRTKEFVCKFLCYILW